MNHELGLWRTADLDTLIFREQSPNALAFRNMASSYSEKGLLIYSANVMELLHRGRMFDHHPSTRAVCRHCKTFLFQKAFNLVFRGFLWAFTILSPFSSPVNPYRTPNYALLTAAMFAAFSWFFNLLSMILWCFLHIYYCLWPCDPLSIYQTINR